MHREIAVAISSGTLKGVFAQGVLSAIEGSIKIDAYASASSSVISASLAALGKSNAEGLNYWLQAAENSTSMGMSDVVLKSIQEYGPLIKDRIFDSQAPRLMIAVSKVISEEAATQTQTDQAKKLGRKLLIQAIRGDSDWVNSHLEKVIFDSYGEGRQRLTFANFDEVAYASTRMLHEWVIPAVIEGRPYVDASYTCSCPVFDLVGMGYRKIIVIDSMHGDSYDSLFKQRIIEQGMCAGSEIFIIKPDFDIKELGVDFTNASSQGIQDSYHLGHVTGKRFLNGFRS